ncbi:hypothetical protein MCERE19_02050 [Spirosomataceae bacterium]
MSRAKNSVTLKYEKRIKKHRETLCQKIKHIKAERT